jgi:hypothetical protein
MRQVKLVCGAKPIGKALTWPYPAGSPSDLWVVPTYQLEVSGTDSAGAKSKRSFEVLRFGVQGRPHKSPRVVGLASLQKHTIKRWIPDYSVHSARSVERGAWVVYGNFLIHDGPDDPSLQVYATIGCIEICNGPKGFDDFNDYLIELSGPTASNRADQLVEIGNAKNMVITYMKATRPALKRP